MADSKSSGESNSSSRYIHGSTPAEQSRLSDLNARLCLAEIDLAGVTSILDVGCGLGQFTLALAEASGAGVLGIERDPVQLQKATARPAAHVRLEWRQGDANSLPLKSAEWHSFDLVHARFLLEHLSDPAAAVRQMVEALGPNGRMVLMDDDHELFHFHPPEPELELVWRAYINSYGCLGNDPCVGRRLVSLMQQAGCRPERTTFIPYTFCHHHPGFEAAVSNVAGVLQSAREVILENDLMGESDFQSALETLARWAGRPDATLWYALNWAQGRLP